MLARGSESLSSSLLLTSVWAVSRVRFFAVGLGLRPDLEGLGPAAAAAAAGGVALGVDVVAAEVEPILRVILGVAAVADCGAAASWSCGSWAFLGPPSLSLSLGFWSDIFFRGFGPLEVNLGYLELM